MKNRPLGVDTS